MALAKVKQKKICLLTISSWDALPYTIGRYCSHNAYFGGAAAAPVDSNAILADHMFTVPKGG